MKVRLPPTAAERFEQREELGAVVAELLKQLHVHTRTHIQHELLLTFKQEEHCTRLVYARNACSLRLRHAVCVAVPDVAVWPADAIRYGGVESAA